MDIIVGILLLLMGLYVLYISVKSAILVCPKIIEYRYLPRTFEEEQREPVSASVIFGSMFKNQQPMGGRM